MLDFLRYRLLPPLMIIFFTGITQYLVSLGNPHRAWSPNSLLSPGNTFSWLAVAIFFLWGYLSLIVPSKVFLGPMTPAGDVPRYSANGVQFYLVSLLSYLLLVYLQPELPIQIYKNFAEIISSLNIFSLLFCVVLLIKGHYRPEVPEGSLDKPLPYQFYAGIELHPRMFGVDIKQWTNCRVGMLGWALLSLNFALVSNQVNGPKLAPMVNALLINIYLFKFFVWETGYFNTIDITLDRAGYYICWGCLTWVQVFYTFSSFFLVAHAPLVSDGAAFGILLFGFISIILNYATDRQKERFKETNGECIIWGRKAKFVQVEYKTHDGKKKKSKLLTSGFWGLARHLNYVFELLLALSWSLPSLGHGILPFAYFGFLLILLVHRVFRDEEKCSGKYGAGWKTYCEQVPSRMIPGIF